MLPLQTERPRPCPHPPKGQTDGFPSSRVDQPHRVLAWGLSATSPHPLLSLLSRAPAGITSVSPCSRCAVVIQLAWRAEFPGSWPRAPSRRPATVSTQDSAFPESWPLLPQPRAQSPGAEPRTTTRGSQKQAGGAWGAESVPERLPSTSCCGHLQPSPWILGPASAQKCSAKVYHIGLCLITGVNIC